MNNQALYNKIRILKLHKIYGENLYGLHIRDGEESTFIDVSFK
jgi:hypothetical protein